MSQDALEHISKTVDDSDQTTSDTPSTTQGYVPIFNATIRTIVYCAALLASIAGTILLIWGGAHNDIDLTLAGGIVDACGGILASGFGVAYNPSRTSL